MTRWTILLLLLFTLPLIAASCLDTLAGVHEEERGVVDKDGKPVIDPDTGKQKTEIVVVDSDGAPAELIGGILGKLWYPAAIIFGILRWGYTEIRKRKLDGAATALVAGITNAVDKKALPKKALYSMVTEASHIYANREFFEEFVSRIKKEIRKKNKDADSAGASAVEPTREESDS